MFTQALHDLGQLHTNALEINEIQNRAGIPIFGKNRPTLREIFSIETTKNSVFFMQGLRFRDNF